ncbi:MAG: class I SAM-dependent RNA methyltransferase [Deltaproteobacteria bacterium]|nr:class I SAM-dependent RNA methyltransferase [Deltaproteobacteria bacterium]
MIVEIDIERIAEGGEGVGRFADGADAGLVCFVPFVAVGERVRVRVVERKKNYARADLLEVVRPSPDRVLPRCRHFADCGGCDFQHLSYEAQIAAKIALVRAALRSVGAPEIRVVPAPEAYGYRARVKLHVQGGAVGYLARRSSRFVAISECPVLKPSLAAQIANANNSRDGEVWISDKRESGLFEQANPEMNKHLVRDATSAVSASGSPTLELYAGSGNFTIPLALAGESGVAIERDARAAGLLASRLGPDAPFRVHASDVAVVLPELPATFATVLLDPPRDGAKRIIPELLRLHARRIIYVSCDAPTLARDLAALASAYRVTALTLYDFMPQTAHVELMAILERY